MSLYGQKFAIVREVLFELRLLMLYLDTTKHNLGNKYFNAESDNDNGDDANVVALDLIGVEV